MKFFFASFPFLWVMALSAQEPFFMEAATHPGAEALYSRLLWTSPPLSGGEGGGLLESKNAYGFTARRALLFDLGLETDGVSDGSVRLKRDAPSGTALLLGEAAARGAGWDLAEVQKDGRSGVGGERPEKEIGFHALRGGDVVGDHTVRFAADGELLDLGHRATRRETFAIGALRAAAWLAGQSAGRLYSMNDVLGLD